MMNPIQQIMQSYTIPPKDLLPLRMSKAAVHQHVARSDDHILLPHIEHDAGSGAT